MHAAHYTYIHEGKVHHTTTIPYVWFYTVPVERSTQRGDGSVARSHSKTSTMRMKGPVLSGWLTITQVLSELIHFPPLKARSFCLSFFLSLFYPARCFMVWMWVNNSMYVGTYMYGPHGLTRWLLPPVARMYVWMDVKRSLPFTTIDDGSQSPFMPLWHLFLGQKGDFQAKRSKEERTWHPSIRFQ